MATAGVDRTMNIWDVRNLDGPLQKYRLRSAASNLAFSQKTLLGVVLGNVVEVNTKNFEKSCEFILTTFVSQVYKDCCSNTAQYPYMRHKLHGSVGNIQFCPYEDVLGIGHSDGYTSILVPGMIVNVEYCCWGRTKSSKLDSCRLQVAENRISMLSRVIHSRRRNRGKRRKWKRCWKRSFARLINFTYCIGNIDATILSVFVQIQPEMISLDPFEVLDVYVPSLKEKVEAQNALLVRKLCKLNRNESTIR